MPATNTFSKAQDHTQELVLWLDSEEGEVLSRDPWINIGSKHPIPDCENEAEVFTRKAFRSMVDTVVIGRNKHPFQMTEINPYVRMYPYVDYHSERKGNACLGRRESEDVINQEELGNSEKKKMCYACPCPGEPPDFRY